VGSPERDQRPRAFLLTLIYMDVGTRKLRHLWIDPWESACINRWGLVAQGWLESEQLHGPFGCEARWFGIADYTELIGKSLMLPRRSPILLRGYKLEGLDYLSEE